MVSVIVTAIPSGLNYAAHALLSAGIAWPVAIGIGVASTVAVVAGPRLRHTFVRVRYELRVRNFSGVTRVFPVAAYEGDPNDVDVIQRNAADEALRDVVRVSRELKLLLASGWRHIGSEREPGIFWDALKRRPEGSITEVLILDPTSSNGRERMHGLEPAEYAEGIRAVLWHLRNLRRIHRVSVEARVYSEAPIWQMVMTDKEIWLLCARGTGTDHSPVYCLAREAKYGLAYGLQAVWQRRWDMGERIDLDTVTEPDWSLIRSNPRISPHPLRP